MACCGTGEGVARWCSTGSPPTEGLQGRNAGLIHSGELNIYLIYVLSLTARFLALYYTIPVKCEFTHSLRRLYGVVSWFRPTLIPHDL